MLNETVEGCQCLGPSHGPTKAVQAAGMVRHPVIDQAHHLKGDGIGFMAGRGWQQARTCFAKTAAVVFVKIPLPPDGLFAVHQDASLLSQLAVEKFLSQLFPTFGMFRKFTYCAEEVGVVSHVQGQLVFLGNMSQAL